MTEEELTASKKRLLRIAMDCDDTAEGRFDRGSEIYQEFALGTEQGKEVCAAFADEELLDFLKKLSTRLGHSPAQKEVFWPLHEYIKRRFGKWPYALKAAGLSRSAGAGGADAAVRLKGAKGNDN